MNYETPWHLRPDSNFLYFIIDNKGRKRRYYRYDKALEDFENEGIKLYMYTKNLFPTKALIKRK